MRSNDNAFLYDTRMVQRHLKDGKIKEADLDKYLNSLPDVSENAEPLFNNATPEPPALNGSKENT